MTVVWNARCREIRSQETLRPRRKVGGERTPVCRHPVDSGLHICRCTADDDSGVLEICPPAMPGSAQGPAEALLGGGFFPLVAAAHEFKTPLVVMLGYAGLLGSGRMGQVNEKQREMLGEIQDSAERLQRVIQDLLLLYELRASNERIAKTTCSKQAAVNENMQELFNYWAPIAHQKSIQYSFRPADGDPHVNVEPLRLQHIISNLIGNALCYTPRSGEVVVSVAQCFWDRRKAQTGSLFNWERKVDRKVKNAVCIVVSDSGPGIAPEHHEDIFADFVQLAGASSRGTGLGLAIARRLVEAHRGAIWVESEVGKGSEFSVLLSQTS